MVNVDDKDGKSALKTKGGGGEPGDPREPALQTSMFPFKTGTQAEQRHKRVNEIKRENQQD